VSDPGGARRAACGLRRACLLALLAAACGKEGPPLPPLRPEPGHIREVTAVRDGDRIEIRMQIPPANFDGTTPPVMERVEIYMMQTAAGAAPPGVSDLLNSRHIVAVIPVREPDEQPPPAKPPAAPKTPGAAVAGESAVYADAVDRSAGIADGATRHYLVAGATGRSRRGRPSPILSVPLTGAPTPPATITIAYDQTTMRLAWPAQASQQFRVYEASGPGGGAQVSELTTEPIAAAELAQPVSFGATRCFAVRAIEINARVSVVGPIGPGICETPVDTFAPAAPSGLVVTQQDKGMVLTWIGVDAPDLAGYRVLRGEGTGETLQQLLQAPIAESTYVDATIAPGTTYVYVVVAVDTAGNISGQSERRTITAREPSP
jgi:hypothetical protein